MFARGSAVLTLCACSAATIGCWGNEPGPDPAVEQTVDELAARVASVESSLSELDERVRGKSIKINEGAIIDELWRRGRDAGLIGPPGQRDREASPGLQALKAQRDRPAPLGQMERAASRGLAVPPGRKEFRVCKGRRESRVPREPRGQPGQPGHLEPTRANAISCGEMRE